MAGLVHGRIVLFPPDEDLRRVDLADIEDGVDRHFNYLEHLERQIQRRRDCYSLNSVMPRTSSVKSLYHQKLEAEISTSLRLYVKDSEGAGGFGMVTKLLEWREGR